MSRPAPKRNAALKLFDEMAAEHGEEAVRQTPNRDLARKLSEIMGESVHQASVSDWKREWEDRADESEREERKNRERFSWNRLLLANLWRIRPDGRLIALAIAIKLNSLLDPQQAYAAPAPDGEVFSFARELHRVRPEHREEAQALASELDGLCDDPFSSAPAAWEDESALHELFDSLLRVGW